MPLSIQDIENLAPDQASLKAASRLVSPAKWPLLQQNPEARLIWGECQGSGANPYRVTVDESDQGYKCTCPSRKFPCKHALALMWLRVEGNAEFADAQTPQWVMDWLGRRRPTAAKPADERAAAGASLSKALKDEDKKAETPEALARKKAAAEKRALQKRAGLRDAMQELERWIADQMRLGLGGFVDDATDRCRKIAARMVDFKAQGLAGRIDELPSRLLALPAEERAESAISELGKLVLLSRAWLAAPDDLRLQRLVASSETRDDVVNNPDARRVTSIWEVLGERIRTRRDGLVSHATWLLDVRAPTPDFACLLDFYPASAGRRGRSFVSGDQFQAEIVFYPGDGEYRAVLASRDSEAGERLPWVHPNAKAKGDPLADYRRLQNAAPWSQVAPLSFGTSTIAQCEADRDWLRVGDDALPVSSKIPAVLYGVNLTAAVGLWDGTRLDLLSAQTPLGPVEFDS